VEKAGLSKSYQNPKRKLGVTAHFSEIIELKFGRNCHTFFVFKHIFRIMFGKWKMHGHPHFPFQIPTTPTKIYFLHVVITFAKIHLY